MKFKWQSNQRTCEIPLQYQIVWYWSLDSIIRVSCLYTPASVNENISWAMSHGFETIYGMMPTSESLWMKKKIHFNHVLFIITFITFVHVYCVWQHGEGIVCAKIFHQYIVINSVHHHFVKFGITCMNSFGFQVHFFTAWNPFIYRC